MPVCRPGLRAQYFSCLTDIFSKSGSHVYHAYSWYQLFMLSAKLNKGLTIEDKGSMGSAVLLATLAIDPYDRKGPVRCPPNSVLLLSVVPVYRSIFLLPANTQTAWSARCCWQCWGAIDPYDRKGPYAAPQLLPNILLLSLCLDRESYEY